MRLHRPRLVDLAGVDFQPALRQALDHERGAAQIVHITGMLARSDAMRQRDQGALGIAVQQQIRFCIQQHRAAHRIRPVVVMGDAAQRGLDAADDDRRVGISFATALAVDDHCAVRALAACIIGRIGVIVAQAPIRGVAVDHRIHIAGGDAKEQRRSAQGAKRFGGGPVRLGENAHPKPLRFQQAADDRHAKTGVINIGIASDQDDIAAVPAKRIHLGARHRQEGRNTKARSPVFAIGKQRSGGLHEHPGGMRPRILSEGVGNYSATTCPCRAHSMRTRYTSERGIRRWRAASRAFWVRGRMPSWIAWAQSLSVSTACRMHWRRSGVTCRNS